MTTERLEADVQTSAAMLAAATCEWLLMIGELDRREAWKSWECRSMAHWLSWKCAVSLRTGREHVRVARELERLPCARAEFAAGRLSYSKVRALTRIVTAPELEADLVELALVATASQLDTLAAGFTQATRNNDPDLGRRNHDERSWRLLVDDDGTSTVTIHGPTDLIAEMLAAVDTETKRETANDGEGRRSPPLRRRAHHRPPPPQPQPRERARHHDRDPRRSPRRVTADGMPDVDFTVPIRAHGLPISRAAYERFRCDAAIAVERALDDGTIERTPNRDVIPRRVRRAVRARDLGACRWPGCESHAAIHLHHIIWRSWFGNNDIDNIVSLCHYHHRAVHQRGWAIAGNANSTLTFTDRTGRTANELTDRRPPLPHDALTERASRTRLHTRPHHHRHRTRRPHEPPLGRRNHLPQRRNPPPPQLKSGPAEPPSSSSAVSAPGPT